MNERVKEAALYLYARGYNRTELAAVLGEPINAKTGGFAVERELYQTALLQITENDPHPDEAAHFLLVRGAQRSLVKQIAPNIKYNYHYSAIMDSEEFKLQKSRYRAVILNRALDYIEGKGELVYGLAAPA